MRQPMISIIIPAYNVEKYVAKCLRSIQEQTYTNWEAIVIDDGSADHTGSICDDFCANDERFRVYHTKNSGVSEARNYGLSKAKGDIIGFADADDFLESNAFERISQHFIDARVDAVFSGHFRVDENDQKLEKRSIGLSPVKGSTEAAKSTLLEGPQSALGVLWNKYFRRKCIFGEDSFVRFSAEYQVGEDQIWLLQTCLNIVRVDFEASCIYNYRIRNGSAVHNFALTDAKKTEIRAREKMVSMVDNLYPELASLARIKYRSCLNALATAAIKNKNFSALRYIACHSRRYYFSVLKSNLSLKRKAKETLLQTMYLLWGIGKRGENE